MHAVGLHVLIVYERCGVSVVARGCGRVRELAVIIKEEIRGSYDVGWQPACTLTTPVFAALLDIDRRMTISHTTKEDSERRYFRIRLVRHT
jgi:hypothetical protein